MKLNTLKPAPGAKQSRHRVGRGVGSGWGKTAGRGHKGQRARSGGYHKVGFEGGQMPLHRRLPKRGFKSITREDTAEVRTGELARRIALKEIKVSKGARSMIEAAGGTIQLTAKPEPERKKKEKKAKPKPDKPEDAGKESAKA